MVIRYCGRCNEWVRKDHSHRWDDLDSVAKWIGRLLIGIAGVVILVLLFSACGDAVTGPAGAREIPGSVNYCDRQERIFLSPGNYGNFQEARSNLIEHCSGRPDTGDANKPSAGDEETL